MLIYFVNILNLVNEDRGKISMDNQDVSGGKEQTENFHV